jgi:hypothetical protein
MAARVTQIVTTTIYTTSPQARMSTFAVEVIRSVADSAYVPPATAGTIVIVAGG